MRNSKKAAYLCMAVLLMATGCGDSGTDSDVSSAETIDFSDAVDTGAEDSENQNVRGSVDDQQASDEKNANEESINEENTHMQSDDVQSQSDTELDGNIESIADNSVVINKVFHPTANTAVSYADDSEKVLITVYFSDETEFEVWTVKNSGVNGDADTEKRQGAFSDLKQDVHINVTGSYEGKDFYANHIIIYNYV